VPFLCPVTYLNAVISVALATTPYMQVAPLSTIQSLRKTPGNGRICFVSLRVLGSQQLLYSALLHPFGCSPHMDLCWQVLADVAQLESISMWQQDGV